VRPRRRWSGGQARLWIRRLKLQSTTGLMPGSYCHNGAMPVIGVLTFDIHVEGAHSLKGKRSVVKGLKDRLRRRFNVAVAEIGGLDTWQRAVVAAVTVSNEKEHAEKVLQAVENDAANFLGGALTDSGIEWID
jgi:uncharacterized protein YlxP (DUF503 family)